MQATGDGAATTSVSRQLRERLEMGQRVHSGAVQRVAGVALVIDSDDLADVALRTRCRDELRLALAELRDIVEGAPPPLQAAATAPLRERVLALLADCSAELDWPEPVSVDPHDESLVEHFVGESVRNARKHGSTRGLRVRVADGPGGLRVEVDNDVAHTRGARMGAGLGTRLLAAEAALCGARHFCGPVGTSRWRAVLRFPARKVAT